MAHPESLQRLARSVATQVRWRRIEHHALRGAFWAALPAALVLFFKGPLGPLAVEIAGGVFAAGILLGILWGATRRTATADAARLADRAFGLDDRIATALEWADRSDRTPLVDAQIADAT